ncbi:hypothetical protein V8C42DRAFT_329450 [Trichoderma barbatum]
MHDLDCVFCLCFGVFVFVLLECLFACLCVWLLCFFSYRTYSNCIGRLVLFFSFLFPLVYFVDSFSRVRTHSCKRPHNPSQVQR